MMKKLFGLTMMMLFVTLFSGCGNNRSESVDAETLKDVAPTATSVPAATTAPTPTSTPIPTPTEKPEPTPAIPEEPDWSNMQEALIIHQNNPYADVKDRWWENVCATYLNNGKEVKIVTDRGDRTFERCENDEWTEYNIDTLYLPFEYKLILPIPPNHILGLDGFSIVQDKTTQEVVCVRFSEEIGKRTEIPAELLKSFTTNDNHIAYQPYFVDDSDGISFKIMLIEDQAEKLTCFSDVFSAIPKLSKEENCFAVETFDNENEEYGRIYRRNDGSMFTFVYTNVINFVRPVNGKYYLGTLSFEFLPYLFEDIQIEKTDFRWEELSDFTILVAETDFPWEELQRFYYIECIVKIDNTHELLLSFVVDKNLLTSFNYLLEKAKYADYIQELGNLEGYLDYFASAQYYIHPKKYVVPTFDEASAILKKILKNSTNLMWSNRGTCHKYPSLLF